MINKYDIKKYYIKNQNKLDFEYKEQDDSLYDKKSGKYICTLDSFVEKLKKENGQSFDFIHSDHVSLFSLLKCTECGTIIFTYDDERYDPNLKCPICTNYHTNFEYWTKDEIASNNDKKKKLIFYEKLAEEQKIQNERIEKRKGKYDWQIFKKKIYTKKHIFDLQLECNDITNSYLKGLRFCLDIFKKDIETNMYIFKKFIRIPLSLSQFYYQIIYKHLGKCPAELRGKWFVGKAIESKKINKTEI